MALTSAVGLLVKEAAKEAMMETTKQAIKEAGQRALRETTKAMSEVGKESARKFSQHIRECAKFSPKEQGSQNYLKIQTARENPETLPAFFNSIESDSHLKGWLNEHEMETALKPYGTVETQISHNNNRVDMRVTLKKPIRFQELGVQGGKLVSKETTIPSGKTIACECKDGAPSYIVGDIKHIAEQVRAGSQIADESILQISPQLESYWETHPEQAKEVMDTIKSKAPNARFVRAGMSPERRAQYLFKHMQEG